MEQEEINKEIITAVQEAISKQHIIISTPFGPEEYDMDKFINQPAEGILYDLNMDFATLYTLAKNENAIEYVNLIAAACTIKALKEEIETLKTIMKSFDIK